MSHPTCDIFHFKFLEDLVSLNRFLIPVSFMILNWVECIFVWGINETKGPAIVFCSKARRNNTHLTGLLKFPHRHVLEIKKKRSKTPLLKISKEKKNPQHSVFKIKIKCIYKGTDILLPESYLPFFLLKNKKNCDLITYPFFFSLMGEFIQNQKSLFWSKNHFSLEKASQWKPTNHIYILKQVMWI